MEKAINEVFYIAGVKYKCIKGEDCICTGCAFDNHGECDLEDSPNSELIGECGRDARKDGKSVIFIKDEGQKMKRLKKEGFKYKNYCLGDMVHFKGTQAKIIGFDLGDNVNNFIALEVSDELQNTHYSNKKNIKDSNVNYLVYIESPKDYFVWAYAKDIVKVSSNNIHGKVTSPFKIGQRVWDCLRGWGEVVEDKSQENSHLAYPIGVKFDRYPFICRYTLQGQMNANYNSNRTLFFEEIQTPKSALIPKRWRGNLGDSYFYIDSNGEIREGSEDKIQIDEKRHKIGNYFQTHEEASESIIYKAFKI